MKLSLRALCRVIPFISLIVSYSWSIPSQAATLYLAQATPSTNNPFTPGGNTNNSDPWQFLYQIYSAVGSGLNPGNINDYCLSIFPGGCPGGSSNPTNPTTTPSWPSGGDYCVFFVPGTCPTLPGGNGNPTSGWPFPFPGQENPQVPNPQHPNPPFPSPFPSPSPGNGGQPTIPGNPTGNGNVSTIPLPGSNGSAIGGHGNQFAQNLPVIAEPILKTAAGSIGLPDLAQITKTLEANGEKTSQGGIMAANLENIHPSQDGSWSIRDDLIQKTYRDTALASANTSALGSTGQQLIKTSLTTSQYLVAHARQLATTGQQMDVTQDVMKTQLSLLHDLTNITHLQYQEDLQARIDRALGLSLSANDAKGIKELMTKERRQDISSLGLSIEANSLHMFPGGFVYGSPNTTTPQAP